jgi:hypothetical protein
MTSIFERNPANIAIMILLFIMCVGIIISICYWYANRIYSMASSGIIDFANKVNSSNISLSFMIPQSSYK